MRLHDALIALATSTVSMTIVAALFWGLVHRFSKSGEYRRTLWAFVLPLGLMIIALTSGQDLRDTPSARFAGMWTGIGLIIVSPTILLTPDKNPQRKPQGILAILGLLMYGMAYLIPRLVPAGYWPSGIPISVAGQAKWVCYGCVALLLCLVWLTCWRKTTTPAEVQG